MLTPEKTVTYLGTEINGNFYWKNKIEILAEKLIKGRTKDILLKLRYYAPKITFSFDLLQPSPI